MRKTYGMGAKEARELLRYEPDIGKLFWIKDVNSSVKAGDEAGSPHSKGYISIGILGKSYLAHRVCWLIYYGVWPNVIDHQNHDKTDNRLLNLSDGSTSDNMRNKSTPKTNKSGFVGVCWHKGKGRWVAYINTGVGDKVTLGAFKQ